MFFAVEVFFPRLVAPQSRLETYRSGGQVFVSGAFTHSSRARASPRQQRRRLCRFIAERRTFSRADRATRDAEMNKFLPSAPALLLLLLNGNDAGRRNRFAARGTLEDRRIGTDLGPERRRSPAPMTDT